jgi:conjugative transfer region lipoprotein (TIGR03751 family)
MFRTSTSARCTALLLAAALTGCATSKEALLTHGSATMLDIWNQNTGGQLGASGANRELLDARQALRRPLIETDHTAVLAGNANYTRTARTEIYRQFLRLPNPDLVMYVFPHLAGSQQVPVPGYCTVFPLHSRVEYAMPGERIDEY